MNADNIKNLSRPSSDRLKSWPLALLEACDFLFGSQDRNPTYMSNSF